ncbi:SDR family oxidoreductase [Pseudooctadecabacter jejudonensis]|uniref:3-oxoacyl-[acyl-carrier-protein] reductase FabG1 n=1 Tax=Pseudooctadecabacter jejudonensis TaxID=1391910 RepID=A0A1Y5RL40_9RHOB|nr:SDR family oxidoreductase [Pseudooctadecabacter jejudonensis]SLN20136.1 3-oxoacyl-[acyl-carrier-protein] reductase FabG1 [Pseudooctadecabacter jejudonensis]
MSRFEGKRILITGGTSGIGFATAKRIVDEGGEVAVTGTTQDHLDEAGRTLPSGSLVLRNDASDPQAAKELAQKIKDQMGGIDGAFLNAGYGENFATEDLTQEGFDGMMNVNVRGPALQMAQLKPLLNDSAAVLLTASVAPYMGGPNGAIYAATKASCAAMARSWARDMAGRNIRVNSIAPGPIETNFFDALGEEGEEADTLREGVGNRVPLGRFGTSEEVAAVACFLLSSEASFVTGSEYMVDGGMTLR